MRRENYDTDYIPHEQKVEWRPVTEDGKVWKLSCPAINYTVAVAVKLYSGINPCQFWDVYINNHPVYYGHHSWGKRPTAEEILKHE